MLAPNTVYSRYSKFSKPKDPIFTLVVIDQQGQIQLFQFRPSPPAPGNRFSDYTVKTKLRLPFDSDWFVYEGGRGLLPNSKCFRYPRRLPMGFKGLKDRRPIS